MRNWFHPWGQVSSPSSLIAAGTSATYAALFNTAGMVTSSTYTGTFTFLTADQNLPGATAGSPLAVRVNVIVVPEPGTLTLAAIGIVAAARAGRGRRLGSADGSHRTRPSRPRASRVASPPAPQ